MHSAIENVEEVLEFLKIKDKRLAEIHRMGKKEAEKEGSRTVVIQMESEISTDLVTKSAHLLKNYDEKIFISPELSHKDAKKEKDCLRKRQLLIKNYLIDWKILRIRNLKLEHKLEEKRVVFEGEPMEDAPESNREWLQIITLLNFNVRSLLNLGRRLTLANTQTRTDYGIRCLTETLLTEFVPNNALFLTDFTIYRRDRTCNKLTKNDRELLIALRRGINHDKVSFSSALFDVLAEILTRRKLDSSASHTIHLPEVPTSGISKSLIVSSRNSTMRATAKLMNAH